MITDAEILTLVNNSLDIGQWPRGSSRSTNIGKPHEPARTPPPPHPNRGQAPEAWVDAYNAWVAHADEPGVPKAIELPAHKLHPDRVREILKLFEPEADA